MPGDGEVVDRVFRQLNDDIAHIHRPMYDAAMKPQRRHDIPCAVDRRVDDAIKQFGWGVVGVFPARENPSYAYTVGLSTTFRHPEIVVMGFAPRMMKVLLNGVGRRIRHGARYDDWSRDDQIVEGHPVWFRQASEEHAARWAGVASARYGSAMSLLQVFLPDEHGKFPWDEGVTPEYGAAQSFLLKTMPKRRLS